MKTRKAMGNAKNKSHMNLTKTKKTTTNVK
jgi:hypothetical protein